MKISTTKPTRNPTHFSGRWALFLGSMLMAASMAAPAAVAYVSPAAVNLGTAANFAILAKAGISTTGTTSIVGDIGVSPAAASYITGFALAAPPTTFTTSPIVTGKVYAADYDPPTPINMGVAIGDMETAYTAATAPAPNATELGAGDITSMTLAPGVYKWGTGVLISAAGVTLSGSASDVWIFQIAQDLTVASGAIVTLSGGALAKNIFWQVTGKTTLGTTSQFKGNILCATLIEMQNGATLNGRALAQTAVTLDANAVTKPAADITPEAATKLAFGVQPGNTTAGGTITPDVTVRILDVNNNLVTSDSRDVTLAIAANPGSGTLSGTKTVAAFGGVATFSGLSINKTGTGYTLSAASSPSLTGATSSTFDINAGVLHHFEIGAITTSKTAGSAFSVTITAQDANNNTVTSFTGTVDLTTNAGTISPTPSNAFTNGQLTQNVTLTQAGTGKTITATKSGGSETGMSITFIINAGEAAKLAFGVQPGNTAAGGTITPAVTVRILDENNNLVTSDTRDVTLAIAANTGSGTLSGTTTVAASGGVATFSNLSINTTGTGYTLSAASSPVLTGATSSTFDINAIAPPTNVVAADVPNDNGYSLSLTWTLSADDASLTNYYIYRSRSSQISETFPEIGTYTTVEALIAAEETTTILIANVPRGTSSYTDTSIPLNDVTYYYWIQSVAESGASKLAPVGIVTAVGEEPRQFMVSAPYPNPFNSSTAIEYVLPEAGKVTVAVYNTIGQAVHSYDLSYKAAGSHRFVFGADGLTSGMYFFRIDAGYAQSTGKLLYMK